MPDQVLPWFFIYSKGSRENPKLISANSYFYFSYIIVYYILQLCAEGSVFYVGNVFSPGNDVNDWQGIIQMTETKCIPSEGCVWHSPFINFKTKEKHFLSRGTRENSQSWFFCSDELLSWLNLTVSSSTVETMSQRAWSNRVNPEFGV